MDKSGDLTVTPDLGVLLLSAIISIVGAVGTFVTMQNNIRELQNSYKGLHKQIEQLDKDMRSMPALVVKQSTLEGTQEYLEKLFSNRIDNVVERISGTDQRVDDLRRRVEEMHRDPPPGRRIRPV